MMRNEVINLFFKGFSISYISNYCYYNYHIEKKECRKKVEEIIVNYLKLKK